jgi:hypothetical protein
LKRASRALSVRTPQPVKNSRAKSCSTTRAARSGAQMPVNSSCPGLEVRTSQGALSPSSASA